MASYVHSWMTEATCVTPNFLEKLYLSCWRQLLKYEVGRCSRAISFKQSCTRHGKSCLKHDGNKSNTLFQKERSVDLGSLHQQHSERFID